MKIKSGVRLEQQYKYTNRKFNKSLTKVRNFSLLLLFMLTVYSDLYYSYIPTVLSEMIIQSAYYGCEIVSNQLYYSS